LVKVIEDKGHRTTGQLQESIRSEINESGSGFEIVIYATDYAKFVDKGTPAGTNVSIEALSKWIEAKGIATGETEVKGIAFAIQRKIFREGTIQFRQNKKGFIEVMLDESAKAIFKMVLDLFKKEFTLSLTNTVRQHRQTFES
jgi:hypothetical protein